MYYVDNNNGLLGIAAVDMNNEKDIAA